VNGEITFPWSEKTDDEAISNSHRNRRHYAMPNKDKLPPHRVLVQHVDGKFFPVKDGLLPTNAITDEQPLDLPPGGAPYDTKAVGGSNNNLPRPFYFWDECSAIICTACDSRPVLCKGSVIPHIQEQHTAEEFEDLKAFDKRLESLPDLAQQWEDIKLPIPYSKMRSFLRPPVNGWACSALRCPYASDDVDTILKHEVENHAGQYQRPGERISVLVQYITLGERVYFPVALDSDPDASVLKGRSKTIPRSSADHLGDAIPADDTSSLSAPSVDVSSVAESRRSYFSFLEGPRFTTTYTRSQRRAIVASGMDLSPLSQLQSGNKIRGLAYREGDEPVRAVRRFKRATLQAILHAQHKIVMLEESMAQANCPEASLAQLTRYLIDYC
jgi:hypothetical protein